MWRYQLWISKSPDASKYPSPALHEPLLWLRSAAFKTFSTHQSHLSIPLTEWQAFSFFILPQKPHLPAVSSNYLAARGLLQFHTDCRVLACEHRDSCFKQISLYSLNVRTIHNRLPVSFNASVNFGTEFLNKYCLITLSRNQTYLQGVWLTVRLHLQLHTSSYEVYWLSSWKTWSLLLSHPSISC